VVQELTAADQLAAVAGEQLEDAPLGGGEADLLPVPADHLGGEVDREVTGLERSVGLVVGTTAVGDRVKVRSSVMTSVPSRSGRPRSRTTTSGGWSAAPRSAVRPSAAVTTV
jgi:hypothetical protein